MLQALRACEALPFARLFYASPSTCTWVGQDKFTEQEDGQVLAPFRLGMDEALREIHATLNDEVDWRIPRRHLCPRPTGSGPFHLLGVWFWAKVLQRHWQVTCNLVVKDLRPSVS